MYVKLLNIAIRLLIKMEVSQENSAAQFMEEALVEARKAAKLGEVPVGAVVVVKGEIVSRAHNKVEAKKDATAHAEVLALRRASVALGTWRLNNASRYVTLEPCSMCVGAMVLSRVEKLYLGASDPRQGAAGSVFDLTAHPDLPHLISVYSGVMSEESKNLLQDFFKTLRKEECQA